ncbi:MAG TPA: hypothetical protein VFE18_12520 [Phenylobacterium sp.]|jgi:hypothetical protein|uniref:hypothetical protein n=1 Tax=Phenylobacterium sp. TaxID=1871053 RepID=UPI002D2FDC31|nr:hypothetical protein [Phenylobacterium sp.]HZZ68989.1 hypothetical protein [Phenylobacterium sp.]
MFWRIYFWTFVALAILNALGAALQPATQTPTDWVDIAVFLPLALFAVWSQAFDKWLVHPNAWRFVLFGAVFWKSISLGISIPTVIAKGLAINAKQGVNAAESAIVTMAGMAIILGVPPLVAMYYRAYPGGDRPRIRLAAPGRRRAEANA